jgi:uncharacterized protein (TIGR02268 family)
LRVAASNITTVVLNGPLERDSLVVDKTRFKWAEVSDQILILQPFADLGSGERLVVKVNFKDRAVPAQAVFTIITHPTEMDGTVEVDRRANTPEALIAALAERDAQIEDLKTRCEVNGPIAAVRSGLIDVKGIKPSITFETEVLAANVGVLEVTLAIGYEGPTWALSIFTLRNPQGQKPWALGSPVLIAAEGKPVSARAMWMERSQLGPGEQAVLMVETQVPPWAVGGAFRLELPDSESARRFSVRVAKR